MIGNFFNPHGKIARHRERIPLFDFNLCNITVWKKTACHSYVVCMYLILNSFQNSHWNYIITIHSACFIHPALLSSIFSRTRALNPRRLFNNIAARLIVIHKCNICAPRRKTITLQNQSNPSGWTLLLLYCRFFSRFSDALLGSQWWWRWCSCNFRGVFFLLYFYYYYYYLQFFASPLDLITSPTLPVIIIFFYTLSS